MVPEIGKAGLIEQDSDAHVPNRGFTSCRLETASEWQGF